MFNGVLLSETHNRLSFQPWMYSSLRLAGNYLSIWLEKIYKNLLKLSTFQCWHIYRKHFILYKFQEQYNITTVEKDCNTC